MTDCRFVQVADSHTWSFRTVLHSPCQLKKNKLHEQLNKQPYHSSTVHVLAWLVDFSRCRRLSSTTGVSNTAVKFRNYYAAAKHSSPISITDGEKIILFYATFSYISSQYQKYLQLSILALGPAHSYSVQFYYYGNSLYQLSGRARILHLL